MSYPIARIDPTTAGRERSPALWRNALEKYDADRLLGVLHSDDFTTPIATAGGAGTGSTDGRWWLAEAGTTGATSETFNTNTEPTGEAVLTGTAGSDFIGVQAHAGPSAALIENVVLPTALTDSKGEVIFEARVFLNIETNGTLFVGLDEATSCILTGDNTLTLAGDYIGFYRLDSGNLLFVSRNDNDGGTAVVITPIVVKTAAQMAAGFEDAFVKLGFKVAADSTVTVFMDGVQIKKDSSGTKVAVAALAQPEEKLCRKLIVAGGDDGVDPVTLICDWIEAYVAN